MTPRRVELRVGELVLHGFEPADRHRIGGAVRRELARLLTEQGLPPSLDRSGETARLDGGAFRVTPGSRPEAVGVRVAQAVYGGLGS